MSEFFYKIGSKILSWIEYKRYEQYRKKYDISDDFKFNGKDVIFYGDGIIQISENSYVGSFSTIQAIATRKVVIGKNCSISHNVRIYTSSKLPDFDFSKSKSIPIKTGDIIIEDNVWIGANVFINPGVTIGENSVVGANSVVTKNIEAFAIYGGVPAKLIRYKKIDNA